MCKSFEFNLINGVKVYKSKENLLLWCILYLKWSKCLKKQFNQNNLQVRIQLISLKKGEMFTEKLQKRCYSLYQFYIFGQSWPYYSNMPLNLHLKHRFEKIFRMTKISLLLVYMVAKKSVKFVIQNWSIHFWWNVSCNNWL